MLSQQDNEDKFCCEIVSYPRQIEPIESERGLEKSGRKISARKKF